MIHTWIFQHLSTCLGFELSEDQVQEAMIEGTNKDIIDKFIQENGSKVNKVNISKRLDILLANLSVTEGLDCGRLVSQELWVPHLLSFLFLASKAQALNLLFPSGYLKLQDISKR